MTNPHRRRPLGTMIAYGFPDRDIGDDLDIAARIEATHLEIFPFWRALPDPGALRSRIDDTGLTIHSAHGCWGGQSIRANRVDLGQPEPTAHAAAVDDLKRCIDWLAAAGGTCLIVHPGGLSEPAQRDARRQALAQGLLSLAEHAEGTGVIVCVENMPTGVHPGSRMSDLAGLLDELRRPELALAIDTGHAQITCDPATETRAGGGWLRTTHVHDNNGRQDAHLPPGLGTIDWDAWTVALDEVGYTGPIMLECIRHFRSDPGSIDEALRRILEGLTAGSRRS